MNNTQTMYEFRTKSFLIRWSIEDDYDVDLSFDTTGEVREKLESGEFQSFLSTMECIHRPTGDVLATEYLGGCIHTDPSEFRDHIGAKGKYGSYFRDMVKTVCSAARGHLRALNGQYVRISA